MHDSLRPTGATTPAFGPGAPSAAPAAIPIRRQFVTLLPVFDLPPVQGRTLGLSSADLEGGVSLVNVFASWCTACRYEHPLFMRLKEAGLVPIHGLNDKDEPEDAAAWLDSLGDSYARTGADRDGRGGRIAHKHAGPLTHEDLDATILPLIAELRR